VYKSSFKVYSHRFWKKIDGHSQKTFHGQSNSLSADEDHRPFSAHSVAEEDDWMPEDEDELMKGDQRLLGLSEFFCADRNSEGQGANNTRAGYVEK
jgi:hypothetical protein